MFSFPSKTSGSAGLPPIVTDIALSASQDAGGGDLTDDNRKSLRINTYGFFRTVSVHAVTVDYSFFLLNITVTKPRPIPARIRAAGTGTTIAFNVSTVPCVNTFKL